MYRKRHIRVAIFLLIGIIMSSWVMSYHRIPGDQAILELVESMSSNSLDTPMEIARTLGGVWVNLGALILIVTAFAWKKCFRTGLIFLGVIPASMGIYILKYLIDRPRPNADHFSFVEASTTGSFPSGHAYQTILLAILTVGLVLPLVPYRVIRILIGLLVLCLVGSVALSSIYLGFHWPSDILGSFIFAFPSAALLIRLGRSIKIND